jgi:AcrR family transcriptional regulator
MNDCSFIIYRHEAMTDRRTRKKLITAQRQEQILKAALDVFATKGYTAATIPEIAKLASLASGTLYLYYPSKRELFAGVIEILLINPLLSLLQQQSDQEFPPVFMNALQNRLVVLQSDELSHLLSLSGEIQRDPELKALLSKKLLHPFFTEMEKIFSARIEAGELRAMEPAIIVRLVASLMLGSNLIYSLEGNTGPLKHIRREELAREITEFILNGLLKPTSPEQDQRLHEI